MSKVQGKKKQKRELEIELEQELEQEKELELEQPIKIPPRRPAWNVWQGLFLLLFIYMIEFFLGWLSAPQNLDQMEGFFRFLTIGMGEGFIYLVVIMIFFKMIKRPLRELGLVRPSPLYAGLGLFTGVFLFVVVGLLGNFLAKVIGTPAPQSFTLVIMGADYEWQLILLLLLGGVIAPMKEEIVFRGIFYPPFRESSGPAKGILLTAGFFALLHFDLVRFLPLLLGGIVLTWLYEKTSSLWPSIIAHGTWNTLMALALWIQKY